MNKLTIIVDLDSTLNNFDEALAAEYSKRTGNNITAKDFVEWDLEPQFGKTIMDIFHEPGFFLSLDPLPNSVAVVNDWIELGHKVVVATTPPRNSVTAGWEKRKWTAQHFPMIKQQNIVLVEQKSLLLGDVLIDDKMQNCLDFLPRLSLLRLRAHNINDIRWRDGLFQWSDWNDLATMLPQIERRVRAVAVGH
jgi:5'(3')-deoxyribonucleotidase